MGDKDQQTYSVSHPDSLAENNSAGNSHPRRWRRWRRRPRWGPSSPPKCSSGCWPAPLAGSPTRRSFRLQRSPFFTQAMSSSTQSFFMLLCLYHVLAWYTFSHRPDGLHGIVFIKEPIRREIEICREGHSWTVSSHWVRDNVNWRRGWWVAGGWRGGLETETGAWWRRNQEIATCSTKLAHHLRNPRALLNIVVGEPIPGYLVLALGHFFAGRPM